MLQRCEPSVAHAAQYTQVQEMQELINASDYEGRQAERGENKRAPGGYGRESRDIYAYLVIIVVLVS